MNLFQELFLCERLHSLIKRKATGTPQQLARRLNMSKRNLARLIQEMRKEGFPIAYDRIQGRYYYETDVTFEVNFEVAEKIDSRKINGGRSFPVFKNFFLPMPESGTGIGLF